jgi:hypothetical protein
MAMNRIVREHYPASKLPEDLRDGVDPSATVTVTVVEEERTQSVPTLDEIFASRRPPYRSTEDIDTELRQRRDEWDD